QWYLHNGLSWLQVASAPAVSFSGSGPYPVCHEAQAFDQVASQPCSTVVCKLIRPQPYAVCAALQPAFSIIGVSGSGITFADQSLFPGGAIASLTWSFGDGSPMASDASPTHAFNGSGPYQVCLTVVGAPPESCTATLCQWLYIGSGGLPCEQLVSQGFLMLQYDNLVGVLDTSLTSGMEARVEWDFGDGASASGIVAVHGYDPFGEYQLCGTLRAWGPVLSDTCWSTLCRTVTFAAIGMDEGAIAGQEALAWPSPFDHRLVVRALPSGGRLELFDGMGRAALSLWLAPSTVPQPLALAPMPPGLYTLVLTEGSKRGVQRMARQP
ncbi:MAG: PKD domain-containing protein, partial [Flavobacteriales bacterium]